MSTVTKWVDVKIPKGATDPAQMSLSRPDNESVKGWQLRMVDDMPVVFVDDRQIDTAPVMMTPYEDHDVVSLRVELPTELA